MKLFTVGTRSLLYGVHQFLYHPWTVARAWRALYGKWPSWRQSVCILVHDWGYWGKLNMDGPEGKRHPVMGAAIASRIVYFFSRFFHPKHVASLAAVYAHDLTLRHSSFYAQSIGWPPSALYYADKASVLFEADWFYILRARASGEVWEYIKVAVVSGQWPLSTVLWFVKRLTKAQQAKFWLSWYKSKTRNRISKAFPNLI